MVGLIAVAAHTDTYGKPSLSVDGTEFVLVAADGETRKGLELVGATLRLRIGETVTNVTIAGGEEDTDAVGGRVVLYRFLTEDGKNLCAADADGKRLGFPIPDADSGFTLTCTSGAIAKCIRWGYRPWDEMPKGPPLRALHAACINMVRADYGGDGVATTTDGRLVYVCDRFGVRRCNKNPPLSFEAAWGAKGATCVYRPRVPKNVSLEQLQIRYPQLKSRTGRRGCSQHSAFRNPDALLLNRSALNPK